ncbi:MAG: hypothetical protein ABSG38_15480 [Spirochaetia bacterium]|jgi:hypothetical protein
MSESLKVDRNSMKSAATVFAQNWSDNSTRSQVARFLESFIRQAATHTTAWCVNLRKDREIRLNVGPVLLLQLTSQEIWFCAVGESIPFLPNWIDVKSQHGEIRYPKVPIPSRAYSVPAEGLADIPDSLRSAALSYVLQAAQKRQGRSTYWRSHSPGVLYFLDDFLGVHLPKTYSVFGDSP